MESYIVMRLAERILAVMIGGLAIYLGYRLFLRKKRHKLGSGAFSLLKTGQESLLIGVPMQFDTLTLTSPLVR